MKIEGLKPTPNGIGIAPHIIHGSGEECVFSPTDFELHGSHPLGWFRLNECEDKDFWNDDTDTSPVCDSESRRCGIHVFGNLQLN